MWASSRMGFAASGRNAKPLLIPGKPSGSAMWGMSSLRKRLTSDRVGGEIFLADHYIAIARNTLAALAIGCFIERLHGRQAVDVAVVHAECGGDENGVVNLEICCAKVARMFHVFRRDVLATLLNFSGNYEERFELVGNVGVLEIGFHALH